MQTSDFSQHSSTQLLLAKHAALLSFELEQILPEGLAETSQDISLKLSAFYDNFLQASRLLSPAIIAKTLEWISQSRAIEFNHVPKISYIIPVHECDPELIRLTIESLACQIGVDCHSIFVIDGDNPRDQKAIADGLAQITGRINAHIITKPHKTGVARARNTGMRIIQTEFFSWLDANDVIHPLRSLHGILQLINSPPNQRINTSYARVNLRTQKIAIRNLRFSFTGHTSFIAYTSLLNQHGYLADLPYHEDTEYQQRLEFFRVPMIDSSTVDHYLDISFDESKNTLATQKDLHLSSDTWQSTHVIKKHPFLEGSYSGELTSERIAFNQSFQEKYEEALEELSRKHFPCIE